MNDGEFSEAVVGAVVAGLAGVVEVRGATVDAATAGFVAAVVALGATVDAEMAGLAGTIDGPLPVSEFNGGRPIPPLRANISLILGSVAKVPFPLVVGFLRAAVLPCDASVVAVHEGTN